MEQDERFLKIFISPQTCDVCMKKNKEIFRIFLTPVYKHGSREGKRISEVVGYTVMKKCMKCVEDQIEENQE